MPTHRSPRSIKISLVILALFVLASSAEADANIFGQCARQRDLEKKIAACVQATKSTSYPWILHWVYRELARAYRERGENQMAIAAYSRSLVADEREWVRREMEELTQFTRAAERHSLVPSPAASGHCTECFAYLEFSAPIEPESYAMRGGIATSLPARGEGNGHFGKPAADLVAGSEQ